MDSDMALVLGTVVASFAISSILTAWADKRLSLWNAIPLLIAGGLMYYANWLVPEGLSLADIPDAFYQVIGRIF